MEDHSQLATSNSPLLTPNSQFVIRNPYVGPRAFEAADRANFFGRDAEIRQLADLVVAQRAVLLYAPSGAGKSSLINAGLIPALERRRMTVLPVARVGGSAPAEARNPFVYNTLAALLGEAADSQTLPDLSLLDGLKLATPLLGGSEKPRPILLALDQFEELFTLLPGRRAAREEFFVQLQAALETFPNLGLLLAMREEYLAHLDSFRAMLPDRLRARFRLELLGEQAARLAIQAPARAQGVDFTDAAATKLVNDLRQVREQSLDGATETRIGEYVEPVQLQVVCRQVWERVMGARIIQESDIAAVGDVDAALATYYADTVAHIGGNTGAERTLREWCQRLITPQGLRGIVQREAGQSGGLDNTLIAALEDAHLVRAEKRAGAAWYELAHDRLVAPVRDDNMKWFTEHLSLLQRQAVLWDEQKRADGLLLTGNAWAEAREWAQDHVNELTEVERDFVAACREAQVLIEREQKRNRLIRSLAVIAMFLALLAVGGLLWANHQADRAQKAEKTAELRAEELNIALGEAQTARDTATTAKALAQERADALEIALKDADAAQTDAERSQATAEAERGRAQVNQLSAQALALQDRQYDLALLLSVEAYSHTHNFQARYSLLDTLQYSPRLSTFLQGHTGYVGSVAFSPDGKMLASGSGDNTIILWDVAARQQRGQLTGHNGYVASVAFSPDGRMLASGSEDKTIILWDLITFQPMGEPLSGYADSVVSVAFSPDGKVLASGSLDSSIILWDVATRQPMGWPLRHAASITSIAFSPDGKMLASGSLNNMISLWDVATYQRIGELGEHSGSVLSVAFSPDGKTLASGSWDNTIILWDVATQQRLGQPLIGHKEPVLSVAFSPDGNTLASGSGDNTIILWDVTTSNSVGQPLTGHSNWVRSVAFSPDGETLASGSYDQGVILWDVSTYPPGYSPLVGHSAWVESVAFSPDGKMLASGGGDKTIILWDATTRQQQGQLIGHDGYVTSVAFSPDGEMLASGSTDQAIILWNISDPRAPIQLGQPLTGHSASVTDVAFAPDGKILASASDDWSVLLWDVSDPRAPVKVGQFAGHRASVVSLAFSPDGKTLASGSWDNTITLWNVATGKPVGEPLVGHRNRVLSVAFSPDGKTLASGSRDNTIILWNVATQQKIGTLAGHTWAVLSVAFAPDGKILASGSSDKTIILWDVEARQRLGQPFTEHYSSVESVTFSPDGKTLASGGRDNTLILWDVAPDSWAARACYIANRNLTPEEWKQLMGAKSAHRKTCAAPPLPTQNNLAFHKQSEDYLISGEALQAARVFTDYITILPGFSGAELQVANLWNKNGGVFNDLATELKLEPAVVLAVTLIETGGGGFDLEGRMIIRFENHILWNQWGAQNPDLYNQHFTFNSERRWTEHQWRPSPDGEWRPVHGTQDTEWEVFEFARSLDRTAAMESISMGGPQVMGFNYASMGYDTVEDMFIDFNSGERAQLVSLFKFIQTRPTAMVALQNKDFVAFARVYNGPGQADLYGDLIQKAYDTFNQLRQQ